MEEIKEKLEGVSDLFLERLASYTHSQPLEHNVKFLLGQWTLLRQLIGKWGDEEGFNSGQDFLPQSRHDHDHCRIGQRLFHDAEIFIEIIEQGLQGIGDVSLRWRLNDGLGTSCSEVTGHGRHTDTLVQHRLESPTR
jgi:hypothetical protein